MGSGDAATDLLEFTVADPAEARARRRRRVAILGADFVVTDWRQLNRELFTALSCSRSPCSWCSG